ncbi:hypothetical protein AAKU52_000398 [Pedobacter sp. CG_S7]|uniref:plasmid mobilization protein n=1 Tax=Pedobacter sp. CG_S7 TaxID=3143930 RepID=UPI0033985116
MSKNQGGRPLSENKKRFNINVRFDETEFTLVLKNAKIANMNKSEWVRKSSIQKKVYPKYSPDELKIFRDFSGVANNLNQLTKKANESGLYNFAVYCQKTIDHINHYLNQLKIYGSQNH